MSNDITPPELVKQEKGWVVLSNVWSEEFEDFIPYKYYTPHFRTKYAAELVLKLMLRSDDPHYWCMPTRVSFNKARHYLTSNGIPFYYADTDLLIIVEGLSKDEIKQIDTIQATAIVLQHGAGYGMTGPASLIFIITLPNLVIDPLYTHS